MLKEEKKQSRTGQQKRFALDTALAFNDSLACCTLLRLLRCSAGKCNDRIDAICLSDAYISRHQPYQTMAPTANPVTARVSLRSRGTGVSHQHTPKRAEGTGLQKGAAQSHTWVKMQTSSESLSITTSAQPNCYNLSPFVAPSSETDVSRVSNLASD